MADLRDINFVSILVRILAAFLLGGIIGLERGLKNRPAGLRTYMLVCVGSCLIMLTNQFVWQTYQIGDPVRMGAQVVSGIGFLGAGTIVVTRRNQIKGLTTAAGLWAAAAVGLALGIGFYEGAVIGGVAIFVILTLLNQWDSRLHRNARLLDIYIELASTVSLGDFIRQLREKDVDMENVQLDLDNSDARGRRSFTATLKLNRKYNHVELTADIRRMEGVLYLEEL